MQDILRAYNAIRDLQAEIREKKQQLREKEQYMLSMYYVNNVYYLITQINSIVNRTKTMFFLKRNELKRKLEIGTVKQLINNQLELDEWLDKSFFDDFLYLYTDSKNVVRLVFPVKVFCYKLYDDIESGDMLTVKFNEIDEHLDERRNLIVFIKTLRQLRELYKRGFSLAIGFVIADNLRKLHSKAKFDMISIIDLSHEFIDSKLLNEIRVLQQVAQYFIEKMEENE